MIWGAQLGYQHRLASFENSTHSIEGNWNEAEKQARSGCASNVVEGSRMMSEVKEKTRIPFMPYRQQQQLLYYNINDRLDRSLLLPESIFLCQPWLVRCLWSCQARRIALCRILFLSQLAYYWPKSHVSSLVYPTHGSLVQKWELCGKPGVWAGGKNVGQSEGWFGDLQSKYVVDRVRWDWSESVQRIIRGISAAQTAEKGWTGGWR